MNGPEGSTMFYELAERALDPRILEKSKEYIKQVILGCLFPRMLFFGTLF